MSFDLILINNDLNLNSDGTVRTVTDTPKLRQDIIKLILTPIGSVKNHLWYGCSLNEDVIGRGFNDLLQSSIIKTSIAKSLDRLKALQSSQSTTQRVSLAELIDIIGQVSVERDVNDPRQINILVSIFSKRLSEIKELFTIIS